MGGDVEQGDAVPEGAEVYVETDERPVAGGRWVVWPDGRVAYERPDGERTSSVVSAEDLRSSPTWRRLEE